LWEQFNNYLVIILVIAALVSGLLGEYVDALAIVFIVLLNAVVGVIQESKAEQALAALQKMSAPQVQVLRDGHQLTLPGRDLVAGDIVLLEAGNYVPADLRLVETVNLKIEEASLTGESVPVDKQAGVVLDRDIPLGDRRNTAFMGTLISYGRGRGLVTATGMNTQIGLIAEMIQSSRTRTRRCSRSWPTWASCWAAPAWSSAPSSSSTACSATPTWPTWPMATCSTTSRPRRRRSSPCS
jgi:Ca2+-transporting ATPase